MKFFYNYIIESKKDKSLYKGCANDLKERLRQHNNGLVKSTKNKKPWKLIYYEACLDKNDAISREKLLKTASGRRFIKKRLKNYFSKSE